MSRVLVLLENQKRECVFEKNVSVNCEGESVTILSQPQLQVYTRRNIEAENLPQHCQSSNPNMVELDYGESQFYFLSNKLNLDVPIAFRKSVRSCTQHPIAMFVSYHRLNSSFKAFTTNFCNVNTPKTIQDALESLKWKEVVMEEMTALHKNQTWDFVGLSHGNKTLSVNGCLQ